MSYARLLACIALGLALPFSAGAYQQTGSAGGGGGTFYIQSCESDEVLVGIAGRSDAYINAVQPVCAQVDKRGRWMSSITRGPEVGGAAGAAFAIRCNNDEVVRAISGTSGAVIDTVAVLCSPMENGRVSISPPKRRQRAGGTGGRAFGPLDCHSEPAQGLTGATAEFVTSIALICNLPANQQPTSNVVQVSDLTVTTPVTIGTATTINLSIHNPTAAYVRVPWRITVDGAVVAARADRVPPTGDRPITFRTNWTARSARHRIRAELDPANTLNESGFHRIDNTRTLDLVLATIACAKGMRAVATPTGQQCAIATDVKTCSAPGPTGMGPRKKFACKSNADCALGYICSTSPCGGICLRDR